MRERGAVLERVGTLATPAFIGLAAGVVGLVFVAFRVVVAAQGHIGAFVVAGSAYVHPGPYTRGVPVSAGTGYDGQFYYRMALDPLNWSRTALGIHLDTLGRLDRVAYPAIVWLASAGQRAAVPVTMPIVNAACLGGLAGVCACLAREAGRHPLWGLLPAGFAGFVWTLSRDLTELTEALFVMAALLALRRSRPLLAGAFLAVAVLAREPALLVVAALFLARLAEMARGRARPGTPDAAWLVPSLAFLGWQLALRARIGAFAALTSGQDNTGVPVIGLARAFVHYLERLPSIASLLWFGELAVLGVVAVSAAIFFASTAATLAERLAWAGSVILVLCLTKAIWLGDVGFRSLDDLFLFSTVLLLFSRLRLELVGWLVAITWCVVFFEQVLFV